MANEYFTPSGYPATGAAGSSASMRSELALVEDGFDKLPTLTGNGGKIVAVNSGGTGLTASATLSESGGTMTVTGNLSVTGDTTLGNASGDALTIASSAVTWSGNPTHSGNHTFSGGLTLASPLPTSSGGTGLSSFTANRVFYASSTSAIGSSANLTFDGTTLGTSAFTATGNVNLNGGTFTFNDAGADLDARFEGDTDANLLFLDASTDRVGVGTNTPAAKLDVRGNATFTGNAAARQTADFTNTGGQLYVGVESSAGGAVFTGSSAYAGIVGTNTNTALQLAANGAVRATITAAGDVGIGVTPSAWGSGNKAIEQIGGALFSGATSSIYLGQNTFFDTAWKYKNTAAATYYQQTSGAHQWFNAPSGTAGNTISFTQAMTLDGSGNLGIGTATPNAKFEVASSSFFPAIASTRTGTGTWYVGGDNAGSTNNFRITLNSSEFVTLNTSGDVGIGTSSPASKLHVVGSQAIVQATSGSVSIWKDGTPSKAARMAFNTTVADGLELGIYDGSSWSSPVVISPTGEVGIGTNSPGVRLHVKSVAADAIRIEGTTARGGGNVYASFYDPTGRKGYFGYGSTLDDGFYIINEMNAPMAFHTNSAERMRITAAGDLYVGTTTNLITSVDKFVVLSSAPGPVGVFKTTFGAAAQATILWNSSNSGDNIFQEFWTETGVGTLRGSIDYNRAGGLVRYNTTSDYRAKDIIGPVQNPGAAIDALKVYEGKMKGATQSRPMLVAHEAQAVAPYAVSGVKDEVNEDGSPKFQQIDASSLVPLLLAEIQSLRARVAALEAQ